MAGSEPNWKQSQYDCLTDGEGGMKWKGEGNKGGSCAPGLGNYVHDESSAEMGTPGRCAVRVES